LTLSCPPSNVRNMGTRILDFRFGLIDLDGVIFNAGILYRREFGRFLQARYNISAKEGLLFYQGHEALPLEGKFDRFLAQHGRPPGEGAEAVAAFRASVASSRPVVSEGARELLEFLVAREAQLFALSSTESRIANSRMEETELRNFFGRVIGTEHSPGTRGQISLCAEAIGLPLEAFAAQGFVLGSNPEDVTTAGELGFYSIGIAHVFPEAALKAHGAHEVYRHVAHLSLHLRHG
jgi:phosphoglycolate phosphatase-like HAD superfamily hydrolase